MALAPAIAFAAAGCRTGLVKPTAPTPPGSAATARNYLRLPDPRGGLIVRPDHYVHDWLVLGPWTYDPKDVAGDESQGAAGIEFVATEAALEPNEGAEVDGRTWRPYKNEAVDAQTEKIDLDQFFGTPEYAAAYLGCYIHAPKDLSDLILYLGSDDYATVWINGRRVHHYDKARRAAFPDTDVVKGIALRKGWNTVVVKLVDVVLAWDLYFRFADENGNPMKVASAP
jgi:hypothetical protein